MTVINVPHKEEVSAENRKYFDFFMDRIGQVPNLYAMMSYAQQALESYLRLQNRKQELNHREREAISLVLATFHGSAYCLDSHTRTARLNDFTDDQVTEIVAGTAVFDPRLDSLVRLAHSIVVTKGKPDSVLLENFFGTGYTAAHLVDLVLCIGDNTIANLLCKVMMIPNDEDQRVVKVDGDPL